MTTKAKNNQKVKYHLNKDWQGLVNYLLSQGHRLNPQYLNKIDPLLIFNLDACLTSAKTLIIDHHNQIWHSSENFRKLANQWFNEVAYSYPDWCNVLAKILGNRQKDFPFVYGNHIFIKLYLDASSTYHWINLSHCQSIQKEEQINHLRFIFDYDGDDLPQHFKMIIDSQRQQLQQQIRLAYRLNQTYHQALRLFLRQFHSMQDSSYWLLTHPCFQSLDEQLSRSQNLSLQAQDLRPLLLPK
ncbi:hypothetical protein ACWOA0_08235 [Ignavigranum ruoffiae]|uniref:Uncharacterized protein n=1 Tax=Ignavigranum ruoffiae TaxID=89093 RepID=A0A1H9AX45_9LACT|nr:hypothetical protein [Ignavigranum ruoffiae]UPQ85200.1 hypothetical protein M0R79_05945 [Ignavigranum ruoffiae]SEP81189.1 hypothetical protein SAMN04488558_10298 [Ignavigranum ruoffiae]